MAKPAIVAEAAETLDDLMPRASVVWASYAFLNDSSCKPYEAVVQKMMGTCNSKKFTDLGGSSDLRLWYSDNQEQIPGLVAATPYLAIAKELLERVKPRLLIIDPVLVSPEGYEERYEGNCLPENLKKRATYSAAAHFAEATYKGGTTVVIYTCFKKPPVAKEGDAPREEWLTPFCENVLGRKRFIQDEEDPDKTVQAILTLLNP